VIAKEHALGLALAWELVDAEEVQFSTEAKDAYL